MKHYFYEILTNEENKHDLVGGKWFASSVDASSIDGIRGGVRGIGWRFVGEPGGGYKDRIYDN